jgi:hypothetical protein
MKMRKIVMTTLIKYVWWSAPVVVYSHWKSGTERDSRQIFNSKKRE